MSDGEETQMIKHNVGGWTLRDYGEYVMISFGDGAPVKMTNRDVKDSLKLINAQTGRDQDMQDLLCVFNMREERKVEVVE